MQKKARSLGPAKDVVRSSDNTIWGWSVLPPGEEKQRKEALAAFHRAAGHG